MNKNLQDALLWIVALLVLLFGIWICCAGPLQSPKALDAPKDLRMVKTTALAPRPPVPSALALLIPPPDTNFVVYYFAATATDTNGLESDYSNEAIATNYVSNQWSTVTLGWDPSPGTNVIASYKVYWGVASGAYTNSASAGTNLTLTVQVLPPPPTNFVLTLTSGLTNLPPLVQTNPPGHFYRLWSNSNSPNRWVTRYQSAFGLSGSWAVVGNQSATNSSRPTPQQLSLTTTGAYQ